MWEGINHYWVALVLQPDAQVDATSEQRKLRLATSRHGGSIRIVAGNLRGDDHPITGLHAGTTKSGEPGNNKQQNLPGALMQQLQIRVFLNP